MSEDFSFKGAGGGVAVDDSEAPPQADNQGQADAASADVVTDQKKPEAKSDEQAQMDGYRMTPEELRELQDAQAAHAFQVQVEDLARRFPVVRQLVERLAELESKAKKKGK